SQGKLKNQPTYRYWLQEQAWMVLFCKALLLAEQGQHALATESAERLRGLAPKDPKTLYNAACCYALCVAAVARGKATVELTADEKRLRGQYTAGAIAALTAAINHGFKAVKQMEADPDLESIRATTEY